MSPAAVPLTDQPQALELESKSRTENVTFETMTHPPFSESRNVEAPVETSFPLALSHSSKISFLSFPFEIAAKIFLHCLIDNAEPDIHSAPLLLGRICRHWRSVALSSPELWTCFSRTIHITCGRGFLEVSPSRYASLLEVLQLWLSRSATRPLKLTIRYEGIRIQPLPSPIHRLLLQHADRWEHITLGLPRSDLVELFEKFTGGFPLLRSLVIRVPYRGDHRVVSSPNFAPLLNSAQLRWQTLDVSRHCPKPALCGIHWASLTSFMGLELSPSDAHELLSLSPSLRECHMTCAPGLHESPSTPYLPVLLPELREFSWSHFSALTYLTSPALERLAEPDISNHTIQDFLDFLRRSHCPLAYLSAFAQSLDNAYFPDLFAALPHLVELNLRLGSFRNPPSGPCIPVRLPELRILSGNHVLAYLTAPALKRLWGQDISNRMVQHLVDFLLRSHCPLTYLSASAESLDKARLPDLFAALPHLVEMCLNFRQEVSPVPVVSILHGQNHHLPQLTTLKLSTLIRHAEVEMYETIVSMLTSRTESNGVARLRSFKHDDLFILHTPGVLPLGTQVVEGVKALVKAGVDIAFEGYDEEMAPRRIHVDSL
ncbi:hypothetical protein B0H16DRAFT_1858945 [Mycena metata]|uniref:F-box domain-containing protein n=1 Tax=Mycena metata TaxID=1033252 RepID=A0AAD7K1D5_9AGAR|nr:hypothetical protein B0H16DRAFT_1858945 [Mycena metata]